MFGYFSAKCNMFLTYLMDKTSFASQILEANQFVLQRASRRVPDCILTFWTPPWPLPSPFQCPKHPSKFPFDIWGQSVAKTMFWHRPTNP